MYEIERWHRSNSFFFSEKPKSKDVPCKDLIVHRDLNKLLYVGCLPDSLIDGKEMRSIVDFAFDGMGLNCISGDSEDTYNKCVKALRNRLKGSEPYKKSVKLEKVETIVIAQQMNDKLFPKTNKQIDTFIAGEAEKAVENFNNLENNRTAETVVSESFALKVILCGDNLEFVPCYMVVRMSWSKNKLFFLMKNGFEYHMEFKQQKFSLTKFDIQDICSKLEIESKISEYKDN